MLVGLALLLLSTAVFVAALPTNEVEVPVLSSVDIEQTVQLGSDKINIRHASEAHLDKRQQDLMRILKATYFYECPMAGRKQRDFRWRGYWEAETATFYLTGLENIHKIRELHDEAPAFWGTWEGYLCIMRGNFFCSYVYFGKTEGVLFPNGILMSLVTDSNLRQESPDVTELCVDVSTLPPDTCPTMHPRTGMRTCRIHHVDVVVVRPQN